MCESASDSSQLVSRLNSIQLVDRGGCGSGPRHNEMDTTTSTGVSDCNRHKKNKKKKKHKAKDEVVHFPTPSITSNKPFSLLNKKLSSFRKRSGFVGCFCFSQTETLDPDSSTTSDPNHPSFNPQLLKRLIENNHFYSKDCNPHLS